MNNEQSTKNGWTKVGFVAGHGTTNSPQHYSYSDDVGASGTYSYRLKQIDHNGAFTYSQEVAAQTGAVPKVFAFTQNYPNPFNPTTQIAFSLPQQSTVKLKVFNVLGQEVATLVNGSLSAGTHSVTFDARNLASGLYIYRLTADNFTSVKKMMLLK